MIFRLECMLESDAPTRAGVDAEHILIELSKDPQAILRRTFYQCILSLKPPHSVITDEERMTMREVALIAEDGLPGAIDELLRPIDRPITLLSLRALRVALAVVEQALEDRGEWHVLQEYREEGNGGLVTGLVDIFVVLSDEITGQFSQNVPAHTSREVTNQSFRAANDLLRLVSALVHAHPLPSRVVSSLTTSIADVFGCTDAADSLYSQSSPACVAAQETRQTCIDAIRLLASTNASPETGRLGAEVVLRALLEHGLESRDRDPAHHLLQVFCLVDYLLPLSELEQQGQQQQQRENNTWVSRVLTRHLPELWRFLRSLDTENKVHFVRRLVDLDRGEAGIGEWILLEELRAFLRTLRSLEDRSLNDDERVIREYQASSSIQFLAELLGGASHTSAWCVETFKTVQDVATTFGTCLSSLLDQHLTSHYLTDVVRVLAAHELPFRQDLSFPVVLTLLRTAQHSDAAGRDVLLDLARKMLVSLAAQDIDADRLRFEVGGLVRSLSSSPGSMRQGTARSLVDIMEWITTTSKSDLPQLTTLQGVTTTSLAECFKTLRDVSLPDEHNRIDRIATGLAVASEEDPVLTPSHALADNITLSLHDLEQLLISANQHHHNIPIPSTPPRTALKQDIVLGLVTISPPAITRSPASTGLTKTYLNNDFRQLRQTPSARQNTSRLPSMHVDVGVATAVV